MKIAIVGAGAAGCFCAANLRRLMPEADITIYERASKPLQKVAITGGGRCNLTNSFAEVKSLQQVYPRGFNLMKRLFKAFNHEQTMQWWEEAGVRLVVQDDQCVFPRSQEAMEIVTTLLREMRGCHLQLGTKITDITQLTARYDAVIVTVGGLPRPEGFSFLAPLGLDIVPPVPSLFTFTLDSPVTELMGVVAPSAVAGLAGTKFRTEGPLLITHWGMSGPAILKLSSHAARFLAEHDYHATLIINWLAGLNDEAVRQSLTLQLQDNGSRQIGHLNFLPPHPSLLPPNSSFLPRRLWLHLLTTAGIDPVRRCAEVGSKQLSRLVAALTSSTYPIVAKGAYKEEFVTCGGVALSEVNPSTLECRKHENLYFAGEVLDVDAVTGGFNLQAAWTMGMVVARAIYAKNGQ